LIGWLISPSALYRGFLFLFAISSCDILLAMGIHIVVKSGTYPFHGCWRAFFGVRVIAFLQRWRVNIRSCKLFKLKLLGDTYPECLAVSPV